MLVFLTGGVETTVAGIRLRSHNYTRPLYAALVAFAIFAMVDGRPIPWTISRLRAAARRLPGPRTAAWLLAIATTCGAYVFGVKVVGGADSYGYVSQAHLWTTGSLKVEQPFMREVPWPMAPWSFSPLGYLPLARQETTTVIVPAYSPGLPMLMAAARVIGGYQAIFAVVPLFGGLLVLSTFWLGRRLASPEAGLVGAWLVATSPAVLFILMSPMTDVPVAALWTAAFCLALRQGRWSALGAGLVSSIALLVRPNLAPIAPLLALPFLLRARARGERRDALAGAALFALGVVPGAAAIAFINDQLYGSWTLSGYGAFSELFSWSHVLPNLRLYTSWLSETHTPVVFAGLAALVLPFRSIWTGAEPRSTVVAGALVVSVVWLVYCAWGVLDAWWYLRFLLTSWPFMMVGVGALVVAFARLWPPGTRPLAVVAAIALGFLQLDIAASRGVFRQHEGERRYVGSATLVQRLTDPASVIICHQYSGSLRYYAGRMTLNHAYLGDEWLDRAVDFLGSRGAHVYLLVEPWEIPDLKRRFGSQKRLAALDRPPLGIHRDPGNVLLFDLSSDAATSAEPVVLTGVPGGLFAPLPAEPPRLTLPN